jgi:hypothetical protein
VPIGVPGKGGTCYLMLHGYGEGSAGTVCDEVFELYLNSYGEYAMFEHTHECIWLCLKVVLFVNKYITC